MNRCYEHVAFSWPVVEADLFSKTKELVGVLKGEQVWVFAELVSMKWKTGIRPLDHAVN